VENNRVEGKTRTTDRKGEFPARAAVLLTANDCHSRFTPRLFFPHLI
jgi:hypothetical protein